MSRRQFTDALDGAEFGAYGSQIMEELLKTNDPTVISFATALLRAEDIDCFVLDVHMSILDGSLGILPRRMMVAREDAFVARAILSDNEIELSALA
jgi:hypothetical protein